jgi:aminoglycoside 3-N-acetyltransferase
MEQRLLTQARRFVPSFLRRPANFCYGASKSAWVSVRSPLRTARRLSLKNLSSADLQKAFRTSGINPGDTIMVHSSMASLGRIDGGAESVVKALIATVTEAGTILMPTYISPEEVEHRSINGPILDLRTEPSTCGAITEEFRKWPGAYRSSNPIYSQCALGNNAQYLTSNHADAMTNCHLNSPMSRLVGLKGKIVGIGTNLGHVSIYHVIEDTFDKFPLKVYEKPFISKYIDSSGNPINREILRYDDNIAATRIERPSSTWIREAFTSHLARRNILTQFTVGNAACWVMESDVLCAELRRLAEKGITMYMTRDEWKRMNNGDDSIDSW